MAEYCIAIKGKGRFLYYCGNRYAWTDDKARAIRFPSEIEAKYTTARLLGPGLYTIIKEELGKETYYPHAVHKEERMSEKYTYTDIIIDPSDPRIKIGRRYWFGATPHECLWRANNAKDVWNLAGINHDRDYPFDTEDDSWVCMILEKEYEPKYVPFNLAKEKDRKKLRGAWIRVKDYPNIEYQIISMNAIFVFCDVQKDGISPEDLFTSYEFVDGSPCARLVEEV